MSAETTTTTVDDVLRASGILTLGTDPPVEAIEVALEHLRDAVAGVAPLRREVLREGAVRALTSAGIRSPARLVDAALGQRDDDDDAGSNGRPVLLEDVDPWPEPVDGAAVLEELAGTYRRYLAQPDGATTAEALWVVHAHAHDAATVSPLLSYTSATKRCGKTTGLIITSALVPRALPASNITSAALYRAVEVHRPTLLVDEADTFLSEREELRGLLNSGHTRPTAVVVRCAEPDYEPRLFSTWGAKAVAMIGELPDTLKDRSVEIRLWRRRPDEPVERVRLDRLHKDLEPLRRRAARWAKDHLAELRDADPAVPHQLHDRAADNWRPLLAIADAAGGPWPERARRAALLLSGAADDDGDVRVQLLADVRAVMDGRERIRSADLVSALVRMEDRPWPEWRHGQPLSTRGLARLLEPYGVSPRAYRDGDRAGVRGYLVEDLVDVWARYLPSTPPAQVQHPQQPSNDATIGGFRNRNNGADVALTETGETRTRTTDVADVAVAEPPGGLWEGYEAAERAAIEGEAP